jgi:hypothetical protein
MDVNKQFPVRHDHKQEKDSAGIPKFIYLMMFLLVGSSGVIGIAGIRQPMVRGVVAPPADNIPVSEGGAARILVFHLEESGSGLCGDLTVTAAGNALYSSCDNSVEKRYVVSETEHAQLQNWMEQFQAVDFDHSSKTGTDYKTVQLYLNGQGTRQASDAETQQLLDFATALAAKIASQS